MYIIVYDIHKSTYKNNTQASGKRPTKHTQSVYDRKNGKKNQQELCNNNKKERKTEKREVAALGEVEISILKTIRAHSAILF